MKTMSLVWLFLAASLVGCAAAPVDGGTAHNPSTQPCKPINDGEIEALLDRWAASLASGNPDNVLANYATPSILLATRENEPLLDAGAKRRYFVEFLQNRPSVTTIDRRFIERGCNSAVDAGLYTFTFAANQDVVRARYSFTYRWIGGRWVISSHHSSVLPRG